MGFKPLVPEVQLLRAAFAENATVERVANTLGAGNDQFAGKLREHIRETLSQLSYRERGILEMRFGLGDGWSYTLAETGEVFRLTRERIRQIQVKALRKFRDRAAGVRAMMEQAGGSPPFPPRKAR